MDTPDQLAGGADAPVEQSQSSPTADKDAELAALLTSALGDFDRQKEVKRPPPTTDSAARSPAPPPPTPRKPESGNASFDPSALHEVDDLFKNMISQDPLLREQWDKLAESCERAAQNSGEEQFEQSLQDTLKKMTENMQSLPNRCDIPEEELARIWANLGVGADDSATSSSGGGGGGGVLPDIMPLVTNMMQNLLSKDILFPALKDLVERYPAWLQANRDTLSPEDVQRYEKQLQLMRHVCVEFEAESPEDSESTRKERFQRILATMQEMQECGSPPQDLVGGLPDGAPPELDFSKLQGLNPSAGGSQCCIQ